MVKVHTRIKRRVTSTKGRTRSVRPKTFKSEEAAHTHAKKSGVKEYTLENINLNPAKPKIRIVQ